jgi:DNA-binding transcriptional LysR family regulator
LAVLEREAGTSLVDRSPRGVALTGAGHALAARAAQVLDVLAAARDDLDQLTGEISGPVRIASVASAAATFVSHAVTGLRQTHPGISVSVRASEPSRALELLVAGDVELAVVDEYDYVPLAVPDFVVLHELCAEPLVLVVPTDAPRRRSLSLAGLAEADWVLPPDTAACGLAVRSACRSAGFEPVVRWETDDMLLLAKAVAAGHGISVLPRRSVAEVAGTTVRTLREPKLTRRLSVAARASVLGRPVVAAVVEPLERAARRRDHARGQAPARPL